MEMKKVRGKSQEKRHRNVWWMSEISVVKEGNGNETKMYNKESG